MFELLAQDRQSKARRGRLTTAHGAIETPAFIPVGTQGSVKAVSPRELRELDAQIILGNTYHLFVRPGTEVIRRFGGLHKFISWNGPILTDSGGYQIFSLAKLRTRMFAESMNSAARTGWPHRVRAEYRGPPAAARHIDPCRQSEVPRSHGSLQRAL